MSRSPVEGWWYRDETAAILRDEIAKLEPASKATTLPKLKKRIR